MEGTLKGGAIITSTSGKQGREGERDVVSKGPRDCIEKQEGRIAASFGGGPAADAPRAQEKRAVFPRGS